MFIVPIAIAFPIAIFLYGFGKVRVEQRALASLPLSELRYESGRAATSSMGEDFLLDGFKYRVSGAVHRGGKLGFQHAQGKFIQVAIRALNTGENTAAPANISLLRQDGTSYGVLDQFSKEDTSYSQLLKYGLPPAGGGVYTALFDVASDSSNLWLSFHDKDGMSTRIVSLEM